MPPHSPFFDLLRAEIARLGGLHNAHLHLDRVFTLGALAPGSEAAASNGASNGASNSASGRGPRSHTPLPVKHRLISALHASGAYEPECIRARVGRALDELCDSGTRVTDALVDVTADGVDLQGLRITRELACARADRMEVRTAAYNPLGFRDDEPRRWELLEEAAEEADFIAGLPEVDDHRRNPEHIGFEESCVRLLDLARRHETFVHLHIDQGHDPREAATETLVDLVRRGHGPRPAAEGPRIWAVHAISPSTYSEARFERLVAGLLETGIGVICCPTGALGMRQLRPLATPTGNSIARVLDLLAAGVHVRLGSDNVCDMFSPSTTTDLLDEVLVLSSALRYYGIDVLAHLASGRVLDASQREALSEHLRRDRDAVASVLDGPR